jgi:hypothetical protein
VIRPDMHGQPPNLRRMRTVSPEMSLMASRSAIFTAPELDDCEAHVRIASRHDGPSLLLPVFYPIAKHLERRQS